MKIYNLVVCGNDWSSFSLYEKLDDAITEAKSMEEGQKRLEGEANVDTHVIQDYEGLPWLHINIDRGARKYASETKSLFRGEITSTWRIVYEQEVK